MLRWLIWLLPLLLAIGGPLGCSGDEGDSGDGDDDIPGDDDDDDDGTDDPPIVDYVCIPEEEVDVEKCGEYPEAQGWDLDSVVTNLTFKAYYDRDCDGKPEATTLNMYRDIYCHRDKIKSVAIVAGSSCGEDDGIP